jgi:hypothetical protein
VVGLRIRVCLASDPQVSLASHQVTATGEVAQELAKVLRSSRAESLHGSDVVGPVEYPDYLEITLIVIHGCAGGAKRVVTDALRHRKNAGLIT